MTLLDWNSWQRFLAPGRYLDGAALGVPGDGQGQNGEDLCAVRLVLAVQAHRHVAQLAFKQLRHHCGFTRCPAARPPLSPLPCCWGDLLLLRCLVDKHKHLSVLFLLMFLLSMVTTGGMKASLDTLSLLFSRFFFLYFLHIPFL